MRQTTQRKVLAAVLGLGATALLVDKLALGPAPAAGSPPPSDAAAAASSTASAPTPAPTATPASSSSVSKNLLAAMNLREGQWTDDVLKASLRPTPAWALYAEPEPARPAPAKSAEGRFCEKYHLKGLMGRGDSATALIETAGDRQPKVLQIGSVIDGFRLVRVENNIAYFEAGTQHAELTVTGQDK